jgi:thiol-disulfide isomerase/thioredoxin
MIGEQAVVSDAEGRYEISIPRVSVDPVTLKRNHELNVVAFVTDHPLMGLARVDLRQPETVRGANIVLRPDQAPDSLLTMEDNRWLTDRRQKAQAEAEAEAESAPQEQEKYPNGEQGQPAPELDGAAWFNTEARSLKELRGRYVLLDFWFTGCGPCHADFPSVKLVHERFEKHGVTVIAVHDNSSTVEAVREHCRKLGLSFPIVVDQPDGRILEAYRQLGVNSFPSYLLIGPDGKILVNDRVKGSPSLRLFKLEVIRQYVLEGRL